MLDPAVVVIAPGEGEVVGDAPDRRVEILSDRDQLHATVSRFGPGREGADLHVHRRHTDCFFVLDGAFTLRLGVEDETHDLAAGGFAEMPPLVVHGFRNASDGELRYLNLHAPGQEFAAYLRSLRDGDPITYDQEPPPGEGIRPPADARVVTEPAAVAERSGRRVALLAEAEAIGAAEVLTRAGAPPQARHVHDDHVESLYVLEGEVAVVTVDRELHAGPGTWVQVPPGVAHGVSVSGPRPARLLELHTPNAGFGAFVRALGAAEDEAAAAAAAGFDQRPAIWGAAE